MRRQLSKLERAGLLALQAEVQRAQEAFGVALGELGFPQGARVREESEGVLTDEEPETAEN